MKEKEAKPRDIAKKLNITTTTLYDYVNGDGSLKEKGENVMLKD
jgi:predicted transcriptional regulator